MKVHKVEMGYVIFGFLKISPHSIYTHTLYCAAYLVAIATRQEVYAA